MVIWIFTFPHESDFKYMMYFKHKYTARLNREPPTPSPRLSHDILSYSHPQSFTVCMLVHPLIWLVNSKQQEYILIIFFIYAIEQCSGIHLSRFLK